MDWLLAPIDPARVHEVGFAVSWHARSMVLAWGVLGPIAILAARFFKIMPGQDWPNELDNQTWWRSHWIGQVLVAVLSCIGIALVLPMDLTAMSLHNWLGLVLLLLLVVQVLLGVTRGSKGGPTTTGKGGSPRGHHYDMTPWRHFFETAHKSLGYAAMGLGVIVILTGLWKVNAAVWMWAVLAVWWAGLVYVFITLQRRGMAVDTYQAIWGDDPKHPGNQLPAPGWGVRRPGNRQKDVSDDVRSDRGNRVRGH